MRLLLSTLLFLSLVPVAFGQAALLTLPPGSVSAALADAQVTQATAFSPLLNPAAMGALAGAEGGGSVLRFAGRTATFASGVVPLGARVRTGAYAGLFVAPDPLVDPQPGESATSQFQSGLLGAAISVQLGRFQAGGGAKVFVEDVGDTRATWLAYDVGGTATFGGGDVVVGAVLKNFGTALTGQTVYDCAPGPTGVYACPAYSSELPSAMRIGGAWRAFTVREADAGTVLGHVRMLGEYVSNSFESSTFNLGVEVDAFEVVTVRGGWIEMLDSSGLDEESRWTLGAGVRFGRLSADVALLPELGFGTEPGVSFSVRLAR